jgi:AcrR family transcriptional regulator
VTRVSEDNGTRTKILRAALEYVALYGRDRLSMSGVAKSANLARGTLYRYFANVDELLEGLGEFVRAGFKQRIAAAALAGGGPAEKIARLAEGRIDSETWVVVRRLREYQPAFTVEFLTSHMPDYVNAFTEAFAEDFVDGRHTMSLPDFADILARIMLSETLLNDSPATTRKLSMSFWEAVRGPDPVQVVRKAPRTARTATARTPTSRKRPPAVRK